MKKTSKVLSIILCMVMVFGIFSIVPSAVSSSSTPKEMLSYYESCVKTTAKKDAVKTTVSYKCKDTYDLSKLTDSDKRQTLRDLGIDSEVVTYEENYTSYYSENSGMTVTDAFSISQQIKDYGLTLKSSKLTTASNGDITLVFNCVSKEEPKTDKYTYTVKVSKTGLLKSYTYKNVWTWTNSSSDGVDYPCTFELVDSYTFQYKKVPVKSISLSATELKLGYGDTAEIYVTVSPDNATYKGAYVVLDDAGSEIINAWESAEGVISVEAYDQGTTTLEIYSYDGDFLATCEVTVKYSFFDLIIKFFRDLFFWLPF